MEIRNNLSESAREALKEASEKYIVPSLVEKQDELIEKSDTLKNAGESSWKEDAGIAGIGLLLTLLLGKSGYALLRKKREERPH